jgi:hypothetical protein
MSVEIIILPNNNIKLKVGQNDSYSATNIYNEVKDKIDLDKVTHIQVWSHIDVYGDWNILHNLPNLINFEFDFMQTSDQYELLKYLYNSKCKFDSYYILF